jgi:hypothetical protein
LVHDVTGQSRQEADTLRIAAIVVHTEQALPQAKARQRDERQRVRQIEKLESKLREGELGPGDKEVQPEMVNGRRKGSKVRVWGQSKQRKIFKGLGPHILVSRLWGLQEEGKGQHQ